MGIWVDVMKGKGCVWGWCSDRDSHVEECLSCREQVELGHTTLYYGLSLLYLACLTLFCWALSSLISHFLLLLSICRTKPIRFSVSILQIFSN